MKSSEGILLSFVLSAAFLLSTPSARGEVIFNSFGPNDGFDHYTSYGIDWTVNPHIPSLRVAVGAAASFSVGSHSYQLSSVSLGMASVNNPPSGTNLVISIVADDNGVPSGQILETLVTFPSDIGSETRVVQYSSSLNPVLPPGSSFWLVVQPIVLNTTESSDNTSFRWAIGAIDGAYATRSFNFQASGWNDWRVKYDVILPVFRIEGTIVPEPSSRWLLLSGLSWLGLRGLRATRLKT